MYVRAGEPANFLAAPAPDFFFKRLRLSVFADPAPDFFFQATPAPGFFQAAPAQRSQKHLAPAPTPAPQPTDVCT